MSETPAPMKPVALDPKKHKGLKIKQVGSTDHIETSHYAKVYTQEFAKAGVDSPIVFVKGPEGDFMSAVMWGLQPGENLFVKDGMWTGGFFPAYVRSFPFIISPNPQKDGHFYIGLYEDSDYVNAEEGMLLFNEDGSETDYLKDTKDFLVQIYQNEEFTRTFLKKLDSLGLLVLKTVLVKNPNTGEDKDVGGFYVVDKEKLAQLTDEVYLELRHSGELESIYAHLMSLETLYKLVRIKEGNDQQQS